MPEHPRTFMSFRDVLDDDICVLKNDLGEKFTVTKEAAGDVAYMLAEFEEDSDKAEFVADEWHGRADELRDQESMIDDDDESMIDLGGGMVVPLSELLEVEGEDGG